VYQRLTNGVSESSAFHIPSTRWTGPPMRNDLSSLMRQGHEDGPALVNVAERPEHPPAAGRVYLNYPVMKCRPVVYELRGTHTHLRGAQHSWPGSTASIPDPACCPVS
jgi:hypothetical protein